MSSNSMDSLLYPLPSPSINDEIVMEAKTWLRTPWHHKARVKGCGVDCAQFLIAVYSAVDLIEPFETGEYPADWHLHQDETVFLNHLLQYSVQVGEPEVGDVVMFQYGRHPAHGSIYIGDGQIIHAWRDEGFVTITDLTRNPISERIAGYYRLKALL